MIEGPALSALPPPAPLAEAALPLPAARTFLATLQSSACTLPAARARTPRRC